MNLSWFNWIPFLKIAMANTPEGFLKLSKTCMEQSQRMTTPSVFSASPKVNSELCEYLADQLKVAVERADSFLLNEGYLSLKEPADCLDGFKLLHALAIVVESFIRSCCQDAWIEDAVLMPNVSERALSIGFDLKLLKHFFIGSLPSTEADDLYKAEVAIVRKKASRDREASLREVNALLRTKESTSKEYQLAALLRERLGTPRQNSVADSLPEVYRVEMESLTQMAQLGKGSFGTVYKAMWLGIEVAKKTFYAPQCAEFEKEASILGQLCHPNIASLLCYGGHERECCMVMELMDGDLFEMMQKIMTDDKSLSYPFSILEAVDIMLQVGGGMEYLHGMRIVHRDLKATNILVRHVQAKEFDGRMKYILAKLTDFGLSKTKERSMTYGTQTWNMGTPRWTAPEVIKLRECSEQVQVSDAKFPFSADVYSFGMVCYEILTAQIPFREVTLNEVKRKVLRGERPELPGHCPPMLRRLIERCWSGDPRNRPRFGEICVKLRELKCRLLMPYGSDVEDAGSVELQNEVSIEASSSTSRYDAIMEEAFSTNSDLEIEEELCGMAKVSSEARIVVGLDFGTSFSGYAFAHKSKPKEILTFYDWPWPMKPYCKTLTAIYYEPGDARVAQVKSWGFQAWHDYKEDIYNIQKLKAKSVVDLPEIGTYMVRFKLHLASKDAGESSAAKLPKGFTVTQVIADYLREIGASIMCDLRNRFGDQITMSDVQWCVTVPSIWDDHAKKQMEVCMARAGLIRSESSADGSPHPLTIVLELEAASCYCHRDMPGLELKAGDRLLVADIGGETTDIVVQEWVSETPDDFRVNEVTYSTSGLCVGTYVDEQFNKFLFAKIKFLPQLLGKSSAFMGEISRQWEEIKCFFGDSVAFRESFEIQLPSKVVAEWEEWDVQHGKPLCDSYDDLVLTHEDMKGIFDPAVNQILALIADQISRSDNVKVIFLVGESSLPYLVKKIKERFLGVVENVSYSAAPASAVCKGAVMLALGQVS